MKDLTSVRRMGLALVVGLVLSMTLALVGAPMAGAQTDDLDTSGVYNYHFDLDAGKIEVSAEIAITADKPSRSTSRGTTQYYFQGYYLTVPLDIEDLEITQDGVALDFEVVETNQMVQVVEVGFRRNLFYRRTANLLLTYKIDGSAPRSESPNRVNGAYAGFSIWGDPSIEDSEFNIHVPEGFEPSETSSYSFSKDWTGTGWVLVDKTSIGESEFYWELLSLRNDSALVRSEITIDDHVVEFQAWPGDEEWLEFATETAEEGIPALVELVGVPWPIEGKLTIVESYSPYLAGYGGWYSQDTKEIEVGDELDAQTLLHEISHVWFNEDLVLGRWITEGLADVYSAEAAEVITGDEPDDPRASQFDAAAQPLSLWINGVGGSDPETERWSYDAAWTVTDEIVDEIGLDAMRAVLAASENNVIAYKGEGDREPQESAVTQTWRTYLDLLEEVGGAQDLEEVFSDWVVNSVQRDDLQERSETRGIYAAFEERSGDWGIPLPIRQEMAKWDFEDASARMTEAEAVLDIRDETLVLIGDLSIDIPDGAELAYETSEDDLDAALVLARQTRDAAATLIAGQELVDDDRSLLTTIGLFGSDPDSIIDSAVGAFENGDFAGVAQQSEEAELTIEEAADAGTKRAAVAGGAGLLLVGLALFRRRRRSPDTDAGDRGDEPEDDQSVEELTDTGQTEAEPLTPV